jgi:CubicO group peptidase (beta-lactamase class C family)
MKYPRFFFLFLFLVATLSCRQQVKNADIPVTGTTETTVAETNSAKNDPRFAHIDSLLEQSIASNRIAGAVAMVAKGDKIVYYEAKGWNDKEKGIAMRKDDIFRIASMTKSVTSVALMMLYEEGKFKLDEPLSKYIPEFKEPRVLATYNPADTSYTTVPARSEITIRQLLTHTAGIGYGFTSPRTGAIYSKLGIIDAYTLERVTLAENVKRIAQAPLLHQPGQRWTYGLNTDVAGYLVEVLSGQSLAAFFEQRIFKPLGMKDSHFYLPAHKANRLVKLYSETKEKGLFPADQMKAVGHLANFPVSGANTYYSGGGGLSSTAQDYMIFAQMLLKRGTYNGVQILKPATVQLMISNQIGELSLDQTKFGLGFYVLTEEGSRKAAGNAGKFGWSGLFHTYYWIDPQQELVGILMTQVYPRLESRLYSDFERYTYDAVSVTSFLRETKGREVHDRN